MDSKLLTWIKSLSRDELLGYYYSILLQRQNNLTKLIEIQHIGDNLRNIAELCQDRLSDLDKVLNEKHS